MYDIRFNSSGDFSENGAKIAYDAYVLSGTYDGYVLDIN